ncbi:MAG: type III-B CRISPR module RAMP protein Cmr1 [Bacillota bacterium]
MDRLPRGEGTSGRTELLPPPVEPMLDRKRGPGGEKVELVRQTRTYELITPLFGGGVEPRAADPVTPIRASEVRGQLRFWWRACRGGSYNRNLQKMREAEAALWGAASTPKKPRPSKVQVTVRVTDRGDDQPVFKKDVKGRARPERGWEQLAYAAFPLQDVSESESAGKVLGGVKFELDIVFPRSEQAEVEAALWAWETFGGVGARTRRGFGAIRLVRVDGKEQPLLAVDALVNDVKGHLRQYVASGDWPGGVPHLSGNPRMAAVRVPRRARPGDGRIDGEEVRQAWVRLIDCLARFRQSRTKGLSTRGPGRSDWPEANEVRRLAGSKGSSREAGDASAIHKFPRGALGLPIIFHFKGDPGDPSQDWVLQGPEKSWDRLASPLILRPLACKDGAIGLAVILEGTRVSALPGRPVVREKNGREGVPGREFPADTELASDEAKKIRPLNGQVDVLNAFLDAVRREESGATRRR